MNQESTNKQLAREMAAGMLDEIGRFIIIGLIILICGLLYEGCHEIPQPAIDPRTTMLIANGR